MGKSSCQDEDEHHEHDVAVRRSPAELLDASLEHSPLRARDSDDGREDKRDGDRHLVEVSRDARYHEVGEKEDPEREQGPGVRRMLEISFSHAVVPLEGETEGDAETAFLDSRIVEVGYPSVVIHTENLQDVLQTDAELHVRHLAHRHHPLGELEEAVGERRIVLVAQATVETAEGNHLAELQPLDTRYAVQYPAFQIVGQVPRDVLVGDELHRVHHIEGLRLDC